MSNSTTAPRTATPKLRQFHPVMPACPKRPMRNPPGSAPTMPTMMSWCGPNTARKGGKNRRRFPLSARLDVALDPSAVLIADHWTHLGDAVPARPRPARATRLIGRSPACERGLLRTSSSSYSNGMEVENARELIAAPEFMKELVAEEDIRFHGNPVPPRISILEEIARVASLRQPRLWSLPGRCWPRTPRPARPQGPLHACRVELGDGRLARLRVEAPCFRRRPE